MFATPVSCAQNLLRSQREHGGIFGGQGERFVEPVGVQRLAPAEHGGQGLDCDADDIIFRLLRGEGGPRSARGIGASASRDLRAEAFAHQVRP